MCIPGGSRIFILVHIAGVCGKAGNLSQAACAWGVQPQTACDSEFMFFLSDVINLLNTLMQKVYTLKVYQTYIVEF